MNALDLAYLPAVAATAPWWARKTRGDWPRRFGRSAPLPAANRPRLLLHAVSVGEVNALRTLVPLLTPEAEVVVSVGTDTGIARARQLFAPRCAVVRYPLDFSWSVRRFLDAVRPDAVALVELELWPNFVRECGRRGVPVCVVNGRLSERSFRGYRRVRRWMSPVFGALEFAAVQDAAYAERFEAMGVSPGACLITGSMKWDAAEVGGGEIGGERSEVSEAAGTLAAAMGMDLSRPLIVAGSTGPGEEALLHRACPPGVQLLCAPRKPERFDEAAAAMPGCVRRSRCAPAPAAGGPGVGDGPSRFLLDTIGELRHAYSLADVVVIGRSFGNLYGSDPIEPAALGKPVVIGPAVADFASVVSAMKDAGAIVQCSPELLGQALADLMADPEKRRRLGENGSACVRANQGASRRHAELLLALVEAARPAARPAAS